MTAPGALDGLGVIVAGAGGGIGGATVRALAALGARVAGIDMEASRVPDVAAAVSADLTDPDAVARAFAAAADHLGPVSAVVNAVGASGRAAGDGPVDAITDAGWRWTLDVNLTTAFHTCRAAIPLLREAGGGVIVNVSSVLGLGGDRDFATHAYAAAKGAVISLSRSMAVSYAPEQIRVNVVCPGLIETPMSARAAGNARILERLTELQPLTGSFGHADDVAGAVCYLVSPAASFVTGAVLTIDGGWSAR